MYLNEDLDVMGEDYLELVISPEEYESLLKIDVVKFAHSTIYGGKSLNISIRLDPSYTEEDDDETELLPRPLSEEVERVLSSGKERPQPRIKRKYTRRKAVGMDDCQRVRPEV